MHTHIYIRQSMLCVGTENEFVVVVVRAAGYIYRAILYAVDNIVMFTEIANI